MATDVHQTAHQVDTSPAYSALCYKCKDIATLCSWVLSLLRMIGSAQCMLRPPVTCAGMGAFKSPLNFSTQPVHQPAGSKAPAAAPAAPSHQQVSASYGSKASAISDHSGLRKWASMRIIPWPHSRPSLPDAGMNDFLQAIFSFLHASYEVLDPMQETSTSQQYYGSSGFQAPASQPEYSSYQAPAIQPTYSSFQAPASQPAYASQQAAPSSQAFSYNLSSAPSGGAASQTSYGGFAPQSSYQQPQTHAQSSYQQPQAQTQSSYQQPQAQAQAPAHQAYSRYGQQAAQNSQYAMPAATEPAAPAVPSGPEPSQVGIFGIHLDMDRLRL